GGEVVEGGGAGELAEPGARAAAPGVEAAPQPQRLLERLGGQILGDAAIAGQVDEVAVDVVEMALDHGRKARNLGDRVHAGYTPPGHAHVTPRGLLPRRRGRGRRPRARRKA